VIVGTVWPEKLRAAVDPDDELTRETRELLSANPSWVRCHEVPRTLTTPTEWATARQLAAKDPRLAYALVDPNRFGFAQTLAGAHELLEHYRNAPTVARLLIEAAVAARRLGHSHALPEPLLRAMLLALWREVNGPTKLPNGWFERALDYASRPLRADDGVRALLPLDDLDAVDGVEPVGFGLADYLEQHLTGVRRTRTIDDGTWLALRQHTTRTDDLIALAHAARDYSRYQHAESLYRDVAGQGAPAASRRLAWWLHSDMPERTADIESAYRAAAAGGDTAAWRELARWLCKQAGRGLDVEAAYRAAAAAAGPKECALRELGNPLEP
jgi:hypothetical protein